MRVGRRCGGATAAPQLGGDEGLLGERLAPKVTGAGGGARVSPRQTRGQQRAASTSSGQRGRGPASVMPAPVAPRVSARSPRRRMACDGQHLQQGGGGARRLSTARGVFGSGRPAKIRFQGSWLRGLGVGEVSPAHRPNGRCAVSRDEVGASPWQCSTRSSCWRSVMTTPRAVLAHRRDSTPRMAADGVAAASERAV